MTSRLPRASCRWIEHRLFQAAVSTLNCPGSTFVCFAHLAGSPNLPSWRLVVSQNDRDRLLRSSAGTVCGQRRPKWTQEPRPRKGRRSADVPTYPPTLANSSLVMALNILNASACDHEDERSRISDFDIQSRGVTKGRKRGIEDETSWENSGVKRKQSRRRTRTIPPVRGRVVRDILADYICKGPV